MKIAIIGGKSIGATLGQAWQRAGHDVCFGLRDPSGDQYAELRRDARVGTIDEAVIGSDAVVIAIPGGAVETLLQAASGVLDGKLIVDATNDTSGSKYHHLDAYQVTVPQARVFRAFNTLGWENFADPTFGGESADLFYSGPDDSDREAVEVLIRDVGLRPVYVGVGEAAADALDGLTRLWFTLALRRGHGRRLAFRTLGLSPR